MSKRELATIHTERLTLRAFCTDDAQDVFEACSNPVLGHNAGWPPHACIEDSLVYINEIAPQGYVWAAVADGSERVIGSVGLLFDPRTPDDQTTMMLGYWMAQDQWNRGYMTEAARAVIEWGFSEAGLARITTCHFLFNDASRRVIEKCGFEKREIAVFPSDDPNEPDQESQWYELQNDSRSGSARMKHGTIELPGDKVTLRRYCADDAAILYEELGCNPEMARYSGWNPYVSLEMAERFVSETIEGYEQGSQDYSWIIESNGAVVGTIGAYDFDGESDSVEVGYSIFQSCWGRGYASEALALVVQYLMKREDVRCLKAWSAMENEGSRRVLEKAGFVQTETKESALNVDGIAFDQAFYEKR